MRVSSEFALALGASREQLPCERADIHQTPPRCQPKFDAATQHAT